MIMKYIVGMCVILAVLVLLCLWRIDYLSEKNNVLETEKTALLTTVERYKDAQVEANKTIKRLREISQNDKNNFDWYNSRVPNEFIKLLQERHNRTKH